MADSPFTAQVISILLLTPDQFFEVEADQGIRHKVLGTFKRHRLRGIVHEGWRRDDMRGQMLGDPAKEVMSTRRFTLCDGWRVRREFDIWSQRAADLDALTSALTAPTTATLGSGGLAATGGATAQQVLSQSLRDIFTKQMLDQMHRPTAMQDMGGRQQAVVVDHSADALKYTLSPSSFAGMVRGPDVHFGS